MFIVRLLIYTKLTVDRLSTMEPYQHWRNWQLKTQATVWGRRLFWPCLLPSETINQHLIRQLLAFRKNISQHLLILQTWNPLMLSLRDWGMLQPRRVELRRSSVWISMNSRLYCLAIWQVDLVKLLPWGYQNPTRVWTELAPYSGQLLMHKVIMHRVLQVE